MTGCARLFASGAGAHRGGGDLRGRRFGRAPSAPAAANAKASSREPALSIECGHRRRAVWSPCSIAPMTRPGFALPRAEADRADVQKDQADDQPLAVAAVPVRRRHAGRAADVLEQRAVVRDLVVGDEAGRDLHRQDGEQAPDRPRAERRMADPVALVRRLAIAQIAQARRRRLDEAVRKSATSARRRSPTASESPAGRASRGRSAGARPWPRRRGARSRPPRRRRARAPRGRAASADPESAPTPAASCGEPLPERPRATIPFVCRRRTITAGRGEAAIGAFPAPRSWFGMCIHWRPALPCPRSMTLPSVLSAARRCHAPGSSSRGTALSPSAQRATAPTIPMPAAPSTHRATRRGTRAGRLWGPDAANAGGPRPASPTPDQRPQRQQPRLVRPQRQRPLSNGRDLN